MLDKRTQGRPARGAAAVGPQKIVEGMQDALRSMQTNNVTRKDIARFAGVTPALVTYYFPERNTLIEAATLPVINTLYELVMERLSYECNPSDKLLLIVTDILNCYIKDIAIVELYVNHRRVLNDGALQDGVQDISRALSKFFDDWLSGFSRCHYNGRFLSKALLGICRSVAYQHHLDRTLDPDPCVGDDPIPRHAEMICRILTGELSTLRM